jgi:hypothetical protein
MTTQDEIATTCDAIKALLLEKNRAYGDSALNPMRVFSRADAAEQIRVRIDDKLSRLARGHALADETLDQTVDDLMGYLVLLKIARSRRAARGGGNTDKDFEYAEPLEVQLARFGEKVP